MLVRRRRSAPCSMKCGLLFPRPRRHDIGERQGGWEHQTVADPTYPQAAERTLTERIHAYYDETWGDYRWLWLSPRNYAIHFGYWDEGTRSHAQSLLNMNRALAER